MLHVQGSLFEIEPHELPEGMRYEAGFLSEAEEARLLEFIGTQDLEEMRYKDYRARRRVISFGGAYDFSEGVLQSRPDPPRELDFLQERAAHWLGGTPRFTQILLAEYRPGTPLGWHRDVPHFEDIVGVSLMSQATLMFRPYPPVNPRKEDILKLTVAPRSIYLLRGASRWDWQHSVAPTTGLRYSITLRTPAWRGRRGSNPRPRA